jgi:hypothetical protein
LASQWIPREQSKIADNLSIYSDCDDWGIHRDVLEELDALWGTHTVDRFATSIPLLLLPVTINFLPVR